MLENKTPMKIKTFLIITLSILFIIFTFNLISELNLKIDDLNKITIKIVNNTGLLNFSFVGILTTLTIVSLALFIESLNLGYKNSALFRILEKRDKSFYSDLITWILIHFSIYNFIVFIMSFGIFHYFYGLIYKNLDIRVDHYIQNQFLLSILIFVVSDFRNYWFHRIVHIQPFWEFHAFHHSASSLNVITAERSHFLQNTISLLLDAIMFALFKLPASLFIGLKLAFQLLQYLQHTNINWKMSWLGRWIFVSPHAHLVHHSANIKHRNKNFGSVLIIWDRIFGTYLETDDKIIVGLENNPFNKKGYFYDIWLCVMNFIQTIKLYFKKKDIK